MRATAAMAKLPQGPLSSEVEDPIRATWKTSRAPLSIYQRNSAGYPQILPRAQQNPRLRGNVWFSLSAKGKLALPSKALQCMEKPQKSTNQRRRCKAWSISTWLGFRVRSVGLPQDSSTHNIGKHITCGQLCRHPAPKDGISDGDRGQDLLRGTRSTPPQ